MVFIEIPVRYLMMQNTGAEDNVESNIEYVETIWRVSTEESALVLVDVWDRAGTRSQTERSKEIVTDRILPVVETARRMEIAVIHAPGRGIARHYSQWIRYAGDEEIGPLQQREFADWPPVEFRKRTGKYSEYAHHFYDENVEKTLMQQYWKGRRIAQPIEPKPEDYVIATGEQLHRLLKHRRILHLFYVGFATNICLIDKDYGIKAMRGRGYNIILLRDCTSGKENKYTVRDSLATRCAIQQVEVQNGSTTSGNFIKACSPFVSR